MFLTDYYWTILCQFRHPTALGHVIISTPCSINVIAWFAISQLEKEVRDLTKQQELSQSRVEDLLQVVGNDKTLWKMVCIRPSLPLASNIPVPNLFQRCSFWSIHFFRILLPVLLNGKKRKHIKMNVQWQACRVELIVQGASTEFGLIAETSGVMGHQVYCFQKMVSITHRLMILPTRVRGERNFQ